MYSVASVFSPGRVEMDAKMRAFAVFCVCLLVFFLGGGHVEMVDKGIYGKDSHARAHFCRGIAIGWCQEQHIRTLQATHWQLMGQLLWLRDASVEIACRLFFIPFQAH